jgi:hypothetical protein
MKRSPSHLIVAWAATAAMVLGASSFASAGHHGAHVVVPPGQAGPRVGPSSLYPPSTKVGPGPKVLVCADARRAARGRRPEW